MNADQTSIFFIAFAWHLLRVLAEEEDEQRRRDAVFLATYHDPAPAGDTRPRRRDAMSNSKKP